jgi:pyrroline-5-carboxylate reductase
MPGVSERVAVLGAGKMGEALMSGLLRAGRPAGDLLFTKRPDDRTKLLEQRYGVPGPTPCWSRSSRRRWVRCWTSSPSR